MPGSLPPPGGRNVSEPRQRSYFVFWTARNGGLETGLKLTVGEGGATVVLTMPTGRIYRLGIHRRPLPKGTGTALFYLCPACDQPRRHLYLGMRAGADVVDHFGLRCQRCAKLLFRSQGRYILVLWRQLLKESFGPGTKPGLLTESGAWDPEAISDPRLVADRFPVAEESPGSPDLGAQEPSK
jgi:hypothetical protein